LDFDVCYKGFNNNEADFRGLFLKFKKIKSAVCPKAHKDFIDAEVEGKDQKYARLLIKG